MFSCLLFLQSPLVGHPIDTVKTKMQAQSGYLQGSTVSVLRNTIKNEGIMALWRGITPPLAGSIIFRSLQFTVNNGVFGALKGTWVDRNILFTDLNFKLICAGFSAGAARAIIETPLEFIKVRRQTGQTWMLYPTLSETIRHPLELTRTLYTGFGVSLFRTSFLFTSFAIFVDLCVRYIPEYITMDIVGPFIKGGLCATAAWWVVW